MKSKIFNLIPINSSNYNQVYLNQLLKCLFSIQFRVNIEHSFFIFFTKCCLQNYKILTSISRLQILVSMITVLSRTFLLHWIICRLFPCSHVGLGFRQNTQALRPPHTGPIFLLRSSCVRCRVFLEACDSLLVRTACDFEKKCFILVQQRLLAQTHLIDGARPPESSDI